MYFGEFLGKFGIWMSFEEVILAQHVEQWREDKVLNQRLNKVDSPGYSLDWGLIWINDEYDDKVSNYDE